MVFAVVLRSAARAVAIIPAVIRRERIAGPIDAATLYPLCELTTAHSDFLRASDQPAIVPAFFAAIAAAAVPLGHPADRPIARVQPYGAPDHRVPRGLGSGVSHSTRAAVVHPVSRAELCSSSSPPAAASFATIAQEDSPARSGWEVGVLRAGADLGVDEAYSHLLVIEERSWKHAHGTAISAVPHQREFYRLLCDGASRTGRLHLMLMYLDDRRSPSTSASRRRIAIPT